MTAALQPQGLRLCRNLAETMIFAATGGIAFTFLSVPAGYLSGSIAFVAIAALAGRPMHVPTLAARILFVLIGISLGSVVNPATIRGLSDYPLSLMVLLVATIVMSVAGAAYLKFVHKFDVKTAYLAAVPGGMAQVMVLAVESKADERAVAVVQTVRVIVLSIALPATFAILGLADGSPTSTRGAFQLSQFRELAILASASALAAMLAYRARFPGGLLFGAMLASAALHGSGLIEVNLPSTAQYVVMTAFGAVAGARFSNTPWPQLKNHFGAAIGTLLLTTIIAGSFAAALMPILAVPTTQMMVAFAPGASDGMMLLALALHLDPIYVGAHHLVRVFFVMGVTPLLLRAMRSRR